MCGDPGRVEVKKAGGRQAREVCEWLQRSRPGAYFRAGRWVGVGANVATRWRPGQRCRSVQLRAGEIVAAGRRLSGCCGVVVVWRAP